LKRIDRDEIYRRMSRDEIPWNIEEPPQALVELVEIGVVQPCKAIDLGCGTGNYAIYLANRGFDVTGVDISPMIEQYLHHSFKTEFKKGALPEGRAEG